jgi:hypothetical protein
MRLCVIAPSDPRRLTDTWAIQRGTCRAEEYGTEIDLRAIESRCRRIRARATGWRGYPVIG